MSPKERFAANVRSARIESGLSQEDLGYLCDLHRTEISLLERAGREPRLGTIVKLAGALGTTPDALCAGLSWLPKPRRFEVEPPPRGD